LLVTCLDIDKGAYNLQLVSCNVYLCVTYYLKKPSNLSQHNDFKSKSPESRKNLLLTFPLLWIVGQFFTTV